jgi:hypothetical protein
MKGDSQTAWKQQGNWNKNKNLNANEGKATFMTPRPSLAHVFAALNSTFRETSWCHCDVWNKVKPRHDASRLLKYFQTRATRLL